MSDNKTIHRFAFKGIDADEENHRAERLASNRYTLQEAVQALIEGDVSLVQGLHKDAEGYQSYAGTVMDNLMRGLKQLVIDGKVKVYQPGTTIEPKDISRVRAYIEETTGDELDANWLPHIGTAFRFAGLQPKMLTPQEWHSIARQMNDEIKTSHPHLNKHQRYELMAEQFAAQKILSTHKGGTQLKAATLGKLFETPHRK